MLAGHWLGIAGKVRVTLALRCGRRQIHLCIHDGSPSKGLERKYDPASKNIYGCKSRDVMVRTGHYAGRAAIGAQNVRTHVWLSDNRSQSPVETLIVPRSGRCRSAASHMGDCSMAWFVGLRHFAKANFDRKRWVSRALNSSEFPKPMGNTGNECCRTRSWADPGSAIPQPISQLLHVVFRRLSYRSRARRSSANVSVLRRPADSRHSALRQLEVAAVPRDQASLTWLVMLAMAAMIFGGGGLWLSRHIR